MDISAPLYAIPWFMTIYADCLSINNTMHLFDILLSLKDPLFPVFFGVSALVLHRNKLMTVYIKIYLFVNSSVLIEQCYILLN